MSSSLSLLFPQASPAQESAEVDGAPHDIKRRLYLVRHGETLGNVQKVVIGQMDSPLTKLGQRQAIALGQSEMMKKTPFWRRYSSDLPRTQHTAELIDPTHKFTLDERLREIAKGPRQGFPKSFTLDECMESFRDRPEEIPLTESPSDAWKRVSSFFSTVVKEAIKEEAERLEPSQDPKNVLIVGHSGCLRVMLQQLVPQAHPLLQASIDPKGPMCDKKRFLIPNASVNMIDLTIPKGFNPLDMKDDTDMWNFIKRDVVELNWIGHYDNV